MHKYYADDKTMWTQKSDTTKKIKKIKSEEKIMNEIKVFEKEEFGKVRTVVIDNTVWFIGKDVAEALGYSNTKDALIKHIDKEDKKILKGSDLRPLENHIPKSVLSVDFVSSDIPNRGLTIINESGVYALIFGSKLESAKEFKHWVTSEILPSIRKTDGSKLKLLEPVKEPLMLQKDDRFEFNLSDVDTFEENNWIWFCLSDIGKILEISNTRDWNKWFDEDEVKLVSKKSTADTQNRNYTYIKETALYRILNKTNSPKAKPFERWITKEVIPSIRKNGSYSVSTFTSEDMMKALTQNITMLSNCVMANNAQLQDHSARIEKLEKEFEQKKVEVAPDLPPKEHIIALVRNHADKTKETDYAKLYRQLYSDYGLRTHTNPATKAKNRNMTTISFIEKEGDINLLLSIAEKLFGFGA